MNNTEQQFLKALDDKLWKAADARTIHQELLAAEAMALMERHRISALVVVDDQNTIIGIVTLLALLKAGLS